ncbi:MAG: hypothetical protein FWG66_12095 [Spirochaetes bacterium]|nr:hypothetical protein [Spirochaetota bacterium]
MKKSFSKTRGVLPLFGAIVLAGISLGLGSCSTGDKLNEAIGIPGGRSSVPPVFIGSSAVSETEINFEFSAPVRVVRLEFTPALDIARVEDGGTVRVILNESPGHGVSLVADLLAEDEDGNTIQVLTPLRSRNGRVPQMEINELRTVFSRPRAEFIEFKMLSDGNLGALRLFIASNPRNPLVYEFPPAEVKQGELVVLHMRTLDEGQSRDELGDNLAESGGQDASDTARDLWIAGSARLLRPTDAVYVLDQDGRVVAAVMLSESPAGLWQAGHFQEAAEFLHSQGAWRAAGGGVPAPADAVDTSRVGTSFTRSVSRDESVADTGTNADWYISGTVGANHGATPGRPNNPRRH